MPRIRIETASKKVIDSLSNLEAFNIAFSKQHEKIFNDLLITELSLRKRNQPGLGKIPDASFLYGKDLIIIEIGHNGLYQEPLHNVNKSFRDIEKWDHVNCRIFTIQIIEDILQINPTHIHVSPYYYYNNWGKGINYYLNFRNEIITNEQILDREFNLIDINKCYYKSKIYNSNGTSIQFHLIITGPHVGNSNAVKTQLTYLK
jgi:hypothetical protein